MVLKGFRKVNGIMKMLITCDEGFRLTGKTDIVERSRVKGKKAEKIAVRWLEKRGFTICYWHEGKASGEPFDILAEKGKERWAIDVKTGRKTGINLERFKELIDKIEVEYCDKESNEKRKFRHNIVGYAIVDKNKDVFLFGYNKYKWRAIKAWETIKRK